MARKRFLTPDIWSDAFIVRLSPEERLLFIGMITLADDEGRLRAEPSYLKGEIFPMDELSVQEVAALRDHLASISKSMRKRSVYLYKVCGMCYGLLPNWPKYQAPSHPTASRLPAPPRFKNNQKPPEDLAKVSGDVRDLGRGVGIGMGSDQGSGSNTPYSPPFRGTGREKKQTAWDRYKHLVRRTDDGQPLSGKHRDKVKH